MSMNKILSDQKAVIESIRERLPSMTSGDSVKENETQRSSIFSSTIGSKEFAFDAVLVNTGPYRKALTTRVYRRTLNSLKTQSSILKHRDGPTGGTFHAAEPVDMETKPWQDSEVEGKSNPGPKIRTFP